MVQCGSLKNRQENMMGLLTALLQPFASQWLLRAKVAFVYLVTFLSFLVFELMKTTHEAMWSLGICTTYGKVLHNWTTHDVKDHLSWVLCKQIPFAAVNLSPNSLPWHLMIPISGEMVKWCLMFRRKLHPSRPEAVQVPDMKTGENVRIFAGEMQEHP